LGLVSLSSRNHYAGPRGLTLLLFESLSLNLKASCLQVGHSRGTALALVGMLCLLAWATEVIKVRLGIKLGQRFLFGAAMTAWPVLSPPRS